MAASFGEQLRTAREARGVTLREISDQTRIPMRYLEAIENNDYKPLPGGIFNRSFIKKYANYIGFDENEAVESYSRTAREMGTSSDEVSTTPYASQSMIYMDSASTRSPVVTFLLMAVILGILSLGVYAVLHWYQRRAVEPAKAPATPQSQAGVKSATNPAPTSSPVDTSPASTEFRVQLKAVGLPVWVHTVSDDGTTVVTTLQPGDTREFSPGQQVYIKLAKMNTNALHVTINGREAKLPYDTKGNSAEITIKRDSYAQYLQ
jgi:cytoskeleton protein RodZ